MYEAGRRSSGYVPNFLRPFALQPELYAAWEGLLSSVKAGMTPLRYELVTLVAARAMRSRYCVLAHASVLLDGMLDDEALIAVVTDPPASGLPPAEVAVVEFAGRIAVDPRAATRAEVDVLLGHGLSEQDVFSVVTAVAARQFFTTVLAATGTGPDTAYESMDPQLVRTLAG